MLELMALTIKIMVHIVDAGTDAEYSEDVKGNSDGDDEDIIITKRMKATTMINKPE